MIIYNVTVNINHDVHDDWLQWMKETHITDVLNTGLFTEYRILRVLGDEGSGGVTYSVQYYCDNMDRYNEYQKTHAPKLQEEHTRRYKDKFVAFRTLLEVVE
jgi:Domain of unknown function (DUF4286)